MDFAYSYWHSTALKKEKKCYLLKNVIMQKVRLKKLDSSFLKVFKYLKCKFEMLIITAC